MKYTALLCLTLSCGVVVSAFCAEREPPLGRTQPNVDPKGYDRLIAKAASCVFRGLEPPEIEQLEAEAAYGSLAREKKEVAEWIYAALRSDPKKSPMAYGYVLSRFGPDYVCGLEATVLASDHERVRQNGAYILGMGGDDKSVVDLAVRVLQRDPSPKVKAEAIHALHNLRATSRADAVLPYLSADDSGVRKAAVQFFWSYALPEALERLKARLRVENDYDVGFWLSWTLCRYPHFSARALLDHRNAGVRCGALRYFSDCAHDRDRFRDEDYVAIVERVNIETDALSRLEMAGCLAGRRDPRCLPLLIDILKGTENPERIRERTEAKAAALSRLRNLTHLRFDVTDEDRQRARQTGTDAYAGAAQKYDDWWKANKGRLRWDDSQARFVLREKE